MRISMVRVALNSPQTAPGESLWVTAHVKLANVTTIRAHSYANLSQAPCYSIMVLRTPNRTLPCFCPAADLPFDPRAHGAPVIVVTGPFLGVFSFMARFSVERGRFDT